MRPNDPRPIRRSEAGFTLIEVLAVVVIMSLLAGMAGWSLRGTLGRATLDETAGRLLDFDARARARARLRGASLELQFDDERITQHWLDETIEADDPAPGLLPADYDYRLERPDSVTADSRRVTIGPAGRSASYALRIGNGADRVRWVVICGLTGEGDILHDDATMQDIQTVWAQRRLAQ